MSSRPSDLQPVAEIVEQALSLLRAAPDAGMPAPAPLPSLLEQCRALVDRSAALDKEPIRMVHHFACTGGTLISRCLATLPNTFMFSELDPLSPLGFSTASPRFAPTDVIGHLNLSLRPPPERLREEAFLSAMDTIRRRLAETGMRMIVREHTHSHYCTGERIPDRPSVRGLMARQARVISLVTVRHPVESFISLSRLIKGEGHFRPFTFDEYCRRYLAFLDDCSELPLIRYEDFVAAPTACMERMCSILELPISDGFTELLPLVRLTGDSGRSGDRIETREAKALPDALVEQTNNSEFWPRLRDRLGY